MSKRAFSGNHGSGHAEANAKESRPSKSSPPGKGFNNSGGDGHALSGAGPRSYRVREGAWRNNGGDGHAEAHPKSGKKAPAPGDGHKGGKGTGHALGAGTTHKASDSKGAGDAFAAGEGTGHALRKSESPHKKAKPGGHPGTEKNNGGKVVEASKKTPYQQPRYGLSEPKTRYTSMDQVVAYRKQKYGS